MPAFFFFFFFFFFFSFRIFFFFSCSSLKNETYGNFEVTCIGRYLDLVVDKFTSQKTCTKIQLPSTKYFMFIKKNRDSSSPGISKTSLLYYYLFKSHVLINLRFWSWKMFAKNFEGIEKNTLNKSPTSSNLEKTKMTYLRLIPDVKKASYKKNSLEFSIRYSDSWKLFSKREES